jgi:hypothetical protein
MVNRSSLHLCIYDREHRDSASPFLSFSVVCEEHRRAALYHIICASIYQMKRRHVVSNIYLIMAIHLSTIFINEPHLEERRNEGLQR